MTFFNELISKDITGVAYKNINIKKSVISYFANTGDSTIAELCKELSLSAPKINNIFNELINDGLVKDYGKVDSTGGRRPNVYGLVPESAFFVGVDIKQDHIVLGISDLKKNMVKLVEHQAFRLTNDEKSLENLCKLIKNFIDSVDVPKENILGIGVNFGSVINYSTGYSYSFYHFSVEPLSEVMERQIGYKVFLENDSKAMAFGEFTSGVVKDEKNVLFLNLDFGIGLGVIINSQLYYGKSGFSGEFGHIPIFDNQIICKCGKKGCLETEASGWALVRMFKERVEAGFSSSIKTKLEDVTLDTIIEAANNDDMLSIELITEIGEKLGRGIALLINIFNPELIVMGGLLSTTGEYLRLPIKSSINKYSLSLLNADTQLKTSKLGDKAGVIGACLLVRNRLLSLS
ncbi:ROK family transcriptional regulator [Pedobacter arcticus]|uniref:ROK family transcriptional regulator n=1 Tax=Pedobacter arcticus TaxID=752140 RepID=UPI0002D418BA|nr:ROK family transcriptional regulator [Pedobacter arcticus]